MQSEVFAFHNRPEKSYLASKVYLLKLVPSSASDSGCPLSALLLEPAFQGFVPLQEVKYILANQSMLLTILAF